MSGNFPGGTPEDRPWQSPSAPSQGTPAGQPQWGQGGQPPGGAPQWGQNHQWQPPSTPEGPGWPAPQPFRAPGYQAPSKPGIIPLRPLGLGEILDGAFQACRKNPVATFGTAILFQVIVAVVTVLLTFGLTGSLASFNPLSPSAEEVTGLAASVLSIGSVLVLLTAGGVLVLQGVLIIPIARAVLNERTGFGALWKLAARRILPLLGLGAILLVLWSVSLVVLVLILVGLSLALQDAAVAIVIIGILLAVAAAIWLNIKWVMAPAALMLEGVGPFTALRRSWTLTTRNWWRTFGILVLTSIIVSIITQVVATPISFLALSFSSFTTSPTSAEAAMLESLPVLLIAQAVTAVFTAIGFAFQAGVTALLYVDLRIRREGFDIVLLRENEARATGSYSPVPGQTYPGQAAGGSFGHQGPLGPHGESNRPEA